MTGPSQESATVSSKKEYVPDDDHETSTVVVPDSNIFPVRVDVLSEDKTLRIVDTILLDPTCWPVTLYQPLFDSVEENTSLMAHTILSDAEVQGMGRTVRHFTGRLDLWTAKLQEAVEDQLRPQLWKIATMRDDATPKQHPQNDETLLPISIRLMVDRLMVHEDILWDKHGRVTPFEFARDMASEMNLPDEATIAIATTILEQIHGLSIDATSDPTLADTSTSNSNSNSNSSSKPSPRGVWMMDPKEQAAIAIQVVAQHRSV